MPTKNFPVVRFKADYLHTLRLDRDWSRAELARASGINMHTIYLLESGKQARPDFETLGRFAGALEVDPLSFLEVVRPRRGAAPRAESDGQAAVTA